MMKRFGKPDVHVAMANPCAEHFQQHLGALRLGQRFVNQHKVLMKTRQV